MVVTSSIPGASQGSGLGSDLMAPLLLLLIEKLLAESLETGESVELKSGEETNLEETNWLTQYTGSVNQPYGRPVGGTLTQGYTGRHYGLDFGIPVGTPVKATMDGEVIFAGWHNGGYGNLVILENGSYQTYYAHLSSIPVQVGQVVKAGNAIGLSGNTGNSTGPHLHYEVRCDKAPIDPSPVTLNNPNG